MSWSGEKGQAGESGSIMTAQQAKNIADCAIKKQPNGWKESILQSIFEQAHRGNYDLLIHYSLFPEHEEFFRSLGYDIDVLDSGEYIISWIN